MTEHAQKKEGSSISPFTEAQEKAAVRAALLEAQRRVALTSVPEIYLGEVLLGGVKVNWPQLPEDVVYLGSFLHQPAKAVSIVWGHESFPRVPVGMVLPDLGLDSVISQVEVPGEEGR